MTRSRSIFLVVLLAIPIALAVLAPAVWSLFPSLQDLLDFMLIQELVLVVSILSIALAVAVYMTRRRQKEPPLAFQKEGLAAPVDVLAPPEAEAYWTLLTQLTNVGRRRPLRAIAVLSAERSEGRSTTALNLAITMAQTGRQVLLLDADLRNPALHRAFGLSETRGISDLLLRSCSLAEAIHATGLPHLDVVPVGTAPAAALARLSSPEMADVLEQLKNRADIVIADTPASLKWSDAFLVAPLTDAALFVVRPGEQDSAGHARIRAELTRAGVDVLGVVINDVDGILPRNGRYAS
jgi:capsular exopolysaccharide synthesis family protein